MGVNEISEGEEGFFRRFEPPVRTTAIYERRRPWGQELFIPSVWEICRVKSIELGRPYKLAETNDEQAALQYAVEAHQRLAAEMKVALAVTCERRYPLLREHVQVHLQLMAGCWITAYWFGEDACPRATDQLCQRRRLESSSAEVIDMYCPAGCGKFRGTQAQWTAHVQEHKRVRGMGRARLAEALEMARRAGDRAGVALYTTTWRAEIGGEPPNATGETQKGTAPHQ